MILTLNRTSALKFTLGNFSLEPAAIQFFKLVLESKGTN